MKLDKNQNYILSIRLPDIDQVLMYSDRPNCIVKYITGKQLQKLWNQGEDNFEVDPPNAILSGDEMPPSVVVLHKMKVNGAYAVFEFTSTRHLHTGQLDHVVFNVDSTALQDCEVFKQSLDGVGVAVGVNVNRILS